MTTLGKTVIKALWDEFLSERVRRAVESSADSQSQASTTVGTPACTAAKQLSRQEFPASSARPSVGLPRDGTSSGPEYCGGMKLKSPVNVPIFTGNETQNFRKWIELFDHTTSACGNLSSDEKVRYLGIFLEGPAYRVLKDCGVNASYDTVVTALRNTFLTPEVCRLAAVKFLSRIQTGTETILEYADTLSDLIETAYPRVLSAHLDG
ncbi:MAG: hypothetical protein GY696_20640, partial [Gammaproteobacteria bacterium]|nr:hypothetical protein [Gammaproteobacteria bacterium]